MAEPQRERRRNSILAEPPINYKALKVIDAKVESFIETLKSTDRLNDTSSREREAAIVGLYKNLYYIPTVKRIEIATYLLDSDTSEEANSLRKIAAQSKERGYGGGRRRRRKTHKRRKSHRRKSRKN